MTISGEENVFYLNEEGTRVKISMGRPSFWSDEIPVTGERREMVNQTMMFGKIPYVTTCPFPGKSTLRYLDERDIQGSGMQNR